MLDEAASRKALEKLFRGRLVVRIGDLFQALKTRSRMSVFRRLKTMGYFSSYTHRGSYYTLSQIPHFDERELWFNQGVGFSRVGTLKVTLVELVGTADAGHTHRELRALLRIPVHNTLLILVQDKRIDRMRVEKVYLYVSSEPKRAAEQVARRREQIVAAVEVTFKITDDTLIEVLLEVIRAGKVLIRPQVVVERLHVRGVAIDLAQVKQVFKRYRLEPGKKTASCDSKPSQP